ncbi:MAG: acyl-CoA thioester hydrolase/BAAT C-terminal domain-containing protein [Pseudomonadota bacterium]
MKRLSVIFASLGLAACASYSEPQLVITPSPILQGDPVSIGLRGLKPGDSATLRLDEIRLRRGQPAYYTSSATFIVGDDGRISTVRDAPAAGSYKGVDQAGLFWSRNRPEDQQPDENAALSPLTLSVDIGSDASVEFEEEIILLEGKPGLMSQLLGDAFPGAFAVYPEGEGPHPVIFILGGSEGQDSTARRIAPQFASRGYLAIGVPYYSPAWGGQQQPIPGLPRAFSEIPVDYLETVIAHVKKIPAADADRIGVYGASKGAEYALLAGVLIGGFEAIAAIVPTDVVWEGWGVEQATSSFSWRGQPLPFVPYEGMNAEFQKPDPKLRIPHDAGRAANPDRVEPARIRVETIDSPVFLVGGDKDTVWASGPMARAIKATRDEAGRVTEIFVSRDAGHFLSGDGYQPAAEPDATLKAAAFPAMLAFFERHLNAER